MAAAMCFPPTPKSFTVYKNGVNSGWLFLGAIEPTGCFKTQEEVNSYTSKTGKVIQLQSSAAGDVRFVDRDGDGEITPLDKTRIGNPIPTHTYGFNLSAAYKGLDVSLLFSGWGRGE